MHPTNPAHPPQAAPLLLSCSNCVGLVGMSWRWCTTFARSHGVRILRISDRKQLIVASELFAAIQREAARLEQEAPLNDEQEREQMRAALGLERAQ